MTLADAVTDVYRQVQAPGWASPNLDGLLDVLRDLAWLPPGSVVVRVPDVSGDDLTRLVAVLAAAETGSAGSARPVHVLVG